MGKIVAIGGGEIGRPGYPVETLSIDLEIIRLAGKKRPKVLFIPTASSDSEGYAKVVHEHFGKRLGCKVDVLYLLREESSKEELEEKVFGSDVVYVGGGNTLKMLKKWKEYGVDRLLKKAYEKGIIMSGVSAGAICWFRYGSSDSRRFADSKDISFMRLKGLDFFNITLSPHHVREPHRKDGLIQLMKKTPGIGIALDDNCALEIIDDKYRIISSKEGAGAHKVYYRKGTLHYTSIPQEESFSPISVLLSKQ